MKIVGYQICLRITRFVILVIRPDYQKFCLRSTPAVQTHRLRNNNNPKPHFSSREGINSRCCRFRSIFRRYDRCCCRSCCRWRSIDRDRRIQQTLARDSVFAVAFVCLSRIKKLLGRNERMCCQSIRTV